MSLKRITLTYLSAYLIGGGVGLAAVPDLTLELLQSNQEYGDIMPRVVGMFMAALGGLIGLMVARRDYTYYIYSVIIRTAIVLFLFFLFTVDQDPLFLVFNGIVLLGLIPSYFVLATDRHSV